MRICPVLVGIVLLASLTPPLWARETGPAVPLAPKIRAIPAAPANLIATGVSHDQIDLAWTDNSSDEQGFHVGRSTDDGASWAVIDSVGANVTTYSDPNLDCNRTYYYRVSAYNVDGDSGYCDVNNAATDDCYPRGKAVWRCLLLIYNYTDSDYVEDGITKHLTATMPDSEIDKALWTFHKFPSLGHDSSRHEAIFETDVRIISRPLDSVTEMGDEDYWPSPDDTRPELDLYAPPGAYDAIFVHWMTCTAVGTHPCIPHSAWGLGNRPLGWSNGATYATVTEATDASWEIPSVGEVWLHEWLHGASYMYYTRGYPIPTGDADGASLHGYPNSPTEGWTPYYRDLMSAMVWEPDRDPDAYAGISAPAWRSGGVRDNRYNVFVDYFHNNTLGDFSTAGTVSWSSADQNMVLGTTPAATNTMYTGLGFGQSFTLKGRVFVPSSGAGTTDVVSLALKNGSVEWRASLEYGSGVTKQLTLVRNGVSQTNSSLMVVPGAWYTLMVDVDYETDTISMKGWDDRSNEPDAFQLSTVLDTGWTADQIGFHHSGLGSRVDDLFARAPYPSDFTDSGVTLQGVREGSLAWGDYDNDGDLDILLTGIDGSTRYAQVMRNDGGTFVDVAAGLEGVNRGDAIWGDYDNDGYLDILLTGLADSGRVTKLYKNNNGTSFSLVPGFSFMPLSDSATAWGDYDNDGDLDILFAGSYDSGELTWVIRNNGGGNFSRLAAGLPGVSDAAVAWGDYDNDGDLDALVSGNTGSGYITEIFRNEGNSVFTAIDAGITGVKLGSVAWGDSDSDGDVDILLTGWTGSSRTTELWRNDDGTFVAVSSGLAGVADSSAVWGDYDNDGRLDILVAGNQNDGSYVASVYRNMGSGFDKMSADLEGVRDAGAAWGDVDGDGRLDILYSGWNGSAGVTRLYLNESATANTIPAAPDGLTASSSGDRVNFNWNAAADGETGSAALTYNLRVGTISGDDDIVSSMADAATGYRRLPAMGNMQHGLGANYRLPDGNYYWSVQAVDAGLAGGAFAAEGSFSHFAVPFTETGAGTTLAQVSGGAVAWGDYDNDGDLDIVLSGYSGTEGRTTKLYENTGGAFAEVAGANLTGVNESAVAWGDYDNDGDLDLLLSGNGGSADVSIVYRNDGGGAFTDIGAAVPAIQRVSAAWGDYDNDGDLDLLISGGFSTVVSAVLNNDNGVFSDIGAGLQPLSQGSAAWGDYDNDGDLDILLTGEFGGVHSLVYQNNGDDTFTDIGAGLQGVSAGDAAWGDYDNDGDLDIALAGSPTTGVQVTKLYQNNGGAFSEVTGTGMTAVQECDLAWGDYDNDGDLDLLLSGYDGSARVSYVYSNDGGGSFSDAGAGLIGVSSSATAWGDYDNDGDLDILLSGYSSSYVTEIYRNNTSAQNTVPGSPSALLASITGLTANLSWTAAADEETPGAGLTYNLRVGTSPGGSDVASGMANPVNGYRRIPDLGALREDLSHELSASLEDITPGQLYHWSVQAIDTAFAGGVFAAEGSYSIAAAVVYVDDDFDAGTPGWDVDHFASIQDGIDAVAIGGAVHVAAGTYPETVTLDKNASMTLSGDINVGGSVLIGAGTLNAPAGELSISGDLALSGGTFEHGDGVVNLNGSSAQTISGPLVFVDLVVTNSGFDIDASGSDLIVGNLLHIQSGTFIGAPDLHDLQIETGAGLQLSGNALLDGDWYGAGDFAHNGHTVTFGGTDSLTFSGSNVFFDVIIEPSCNFTLASDANWGLAGTLTLHGYFNGASHPPSTVTITGGAFFDTSRTMALHHMVINPGASLSAAAGLEVAGNWSNAGGFTHNNGIVTFNGGAQRVTGSTTFYDVTVTGGSALELAENAELGFAGVFTLDGTLDPFSNAPTTVALRGTSVQSLPVGATSLHSLTIGADSIFSAPPSLEVAGDLSSTGGWMHNDASVVFNGAGMQIFEGAATIFDTSISSGSILQLASDATFRVLNTFTVVGDFDPGTNNNTTVLLAGNGPQTIPADTFNNLILNDGLLGYWKLDQGGGETAVDSSGFERDGALAGGTSWSADLPPTNFANAFSTGFDGVDDVIEVRIDVSEDAYAASLWFKTSAANCGLFSVDDGFLGSNGHDRHIHLTSIGTICARTYNANQICSSGTNWADRAWHHVVHTYGSAVPGEKLYVDGSVEASGPKASSEFDWQTGINIGYSNDAVDPYFNGLIDDVRVYGRALSLTEVQALAAGGHPDTSVTSHNLTGALDINHDLTLNAGSLDVTASNHAITIAGDLHRNGGVLDVRSGAITFDGSGTQNLITDALSFYDLTIENGVTLVTAANANAAGTLTNLGWIHEIRNINDAGQHSFGLTEIDIDVSTPGNLVQLDVVRRDEDHPQAAAFLRTGRYWSISPTGDSYTVGLTLPHDAVLDPWACRYDGPAWTCDRSAFDGATVSLSGITQLSDWAVGTQQPTVDLSLAMEDAPDPVIAGNQLVYTVTAANAGPGGADLVVVTDALPSGTSLVSTTGCAEDPAGAPSCSLGTIPAGNQLQYTITVAVDPSMTGDILNTASVSSATADGNPGNDSASQTTTVEISTDLSITKDNGQTGVLPGEDIEYTIIVSNDGPSASSGAAVSDIFPGELTIVTWSCAGSGGGLCSASGFGDIVDTVDLPVSAWVTYTALTSVTEGAVGTLSNTATVSPPEGADDPDMGNNSATDDDAVLEPSIFADGFETGDTTAWSSAVGTSLVKGAHEPPRGLGFAQE